MLVGKRPAYDFEVFDPIKRQRCDEGSGSSGCSSGAWWQPKLEACREEDIGLLQEQFPSVEAGVIGSILESCGGDLDSVRVSLQRLVGDSHPGSPRGSSATGGSGSMDSPIREEARKSRKRASQSLDADRNSDITSWAEAVVKTLHGCPSVDVAITRTKQILADYEAEVRQNCLAQQADLQQEPPQSAPAEPAPSQQERLENLQHANRILFRALHNLNERNRRLQYEACRTEALRIELDNSEEIRKGLERTNEMLKGQLAAASVGFTAHSVNQIGF